MPLSFPLRMMVTLALLLIAISSAYMVLHSTGEKDRCLDAIRYQLYEPNFERLLDYVDSIHGRVKCQKMTGLETEIREEIGKLRNRMERDASIIGRFDPSEYPDPADAIKEMRREFDKIYSEKADEWISINSYMKDGKYLSAGDKARAVVKKWYVNRIRDAFTEYFGEGETRINEELENKSSGIPLKEVRGLWKEGRKYLSNKIKLKLTGIHKLKRLRHGEEIFTDSVLLTIEQNPSYLISGEARVVRINNTSREVYPLSLLNICTLNDPTLENGGLRILPSEPWLTTLNIWIVSARGGYLYSRITDENSTIYLDNGISRLSCIRKFEVVHDPFTGEPIGENVPLEFNFSTVVAIIVPPGPQGIGDLRSGMPVESSGNFQDIDLPTVTERK